MAVGIGLKDSSRAAQRPSACRRRSSLKSLRGLVGTVLMAVQAASLEILEKASVPPAQARAFVQAIEIEIAGARDTLATKHDLLVMRNDLLVMRSELSEKLTEKTAELRTEMRALAGSNVRQM